MRILYIHQYFKTLADGGSSRSFYLAKALVEQGCTVDVITSHNERQYQQEKIEGITVHYLPVYYDNALGFLGRIKSFLTFIWQAYRMAASIRHVDVCYATSTPLTVGIIALALKYWHRIPFYFEVRDLWPLAPIQMGAIRNRWLKKVLFALEARIYREADQIVALSPGMAQYIGQIVGSWKVHVIPNMADCRFFRRAKTPAYQPGREPFTIAYFGAVGDVNHLDYLVETARYFQEKNVREVRFQIIGKGKAYARLQQLAAQCALTNLQFIPHVSKYKLRNLLPSIHAVYVSFAQKPVLETSSPNKLFDALAAGKLCIVNTAGWMQDLVETNECGFYAHPNDPGELLRQLVPYVTDGVSLDQAQANARKVAETHFSRARLTRQFVRLFVPLPVRRRSAAIVHPLE